MTHVRGYRRADGTYVRPHHRRTRPSGARPARPVPAPRRVSPTVARPQSASPGSTTRVRGYHRADGTYVRTHHRRISRPAAVAAGGGGTILLILVLLVFSGGGTGESSPSQSPSSPANISNQLPGR